MRFRQLLVPAVMVALLAACADNTPLASSTATTLGVGATATTLGGTPAVDTAAVDTAAPASTEAPAPTSTVVKPPVKLPTATPTKLVITDVTPGTGPAAVSGDSVVVNYVGVRSVDGTMFDNSYDRGKPFVVQLGAGAVIKGWDQGLVGVQTGGRRQLDIPADLAYGDSPPGDPIKAGDALSFVIEVVAIIPANKPTDEPAITVAPAANIAAPSSKTLQDGTGEPLASGDTAATQILFYRADTGAKLRSTWADGKPINIVVGQGQTLVSLETAMIGMKVGERRQITVPFVEISGGGGNQSLGLPANVDLVMVVDLIAKY